MSIDIVAIPGPVVSRVIPSWGRQGVPDIPPPRHLARLAWLKARPQLLATLPSAADELRDVHLHALDVALRGMRKAKLYPSHLVSRPPGLRFAIRVLVSELRGEPVPDDGIEGG